MNPSDLALDASVYYNVKPYADIDAYADFDDYGGRRITIMTGLLRDINYLAAAQVLSYAFDERACFFKYDHYITELPKPPILTPNKFAMTKPFYCPKGSIYALAHTQPDESLAHVQPEATWAEEGNDITFYGLMFVLLHEFAHFKHHDLGPEPMQKSQMRKREADADAFAVNFMLDMNVNPLIALPVLSVVAGVENRRIDDGNSNHPAALKRMRMMVERSERGMRSKKFQRSLLQQKPYVIEENKAASYFISAFLTEADER
jgi:hypothetical protein